MTVAEKVSYIKGLAEGLGVDDSTKEGKVLAAIVDVLDDIGTVLSEYRVGQRCVVVETSEHAVRTVMIFELGENLINDSPHVLADG